MDPFEPHSLFSMDIEREKIVEEWKVHNLRQQPTNNRLQQSRPWLRRRLTPCSALALIGLMSQGPKWWQVRIMLETPDFQALPPLRLESLQLLVKWVTSGSMIVLEKTREQLSLLRVTLSLLLMLPLTVARILGTTKTYLFLIDTLIGEARGRYKGASGFDHCFPARSKPIPQRLQLSAKHEAYTGSVSFTPAR